MTAATAAIIDCELYETECAQPARWIIVYPPQAVVRMRLTCQTHVPPYGDPNVQWVHLPNEPNRRYAIDEAARQAQRYHKLKVALLAADANSYHSERMAEIIARLKAHRADLLQMAEHHLRLTKH